MAYNIYGVLNTTFASRCAPSEDALLVQSYKHTFTAESDTVKDNCGTIVGRAQGIDVTRKISISGIVNGNTNIGSTTINLARSVGDNSVTIANKKNQLGFTSNHPVFIEEISIDESNGGWRTLSIDMVSHIGISS